MGHGVLQVVLLVGVGGGAAGEERPPQKRRPAAGLFQVGPVQPEAGLPAGVAEGLQQLGPAPLLRKEHPVGGTLSPAHPEGQLPRDSHPCGGQLQQPPGHRPVLRDESPFPQAEAPGEQPGPVALRQQVLPALPLHPAQLVFNVRRKGHGVSPSRPVQAMLSRSSRSQRGGLDTLGINSPLRYSATSTKPLSLSKNRASSQ